MIITKDDSLQVMIQKIYDNAKAHGWHERKRSIEELSCLLHSEVSEFFEEMRVENPRQLYFENDKPCGYAIEIADIAIRLMDLSVECSIKLELCNMAENLDNKDVFQITKMLHWICNNDKNWDCLLDVLVLVAKKYAFDLFAMIRMKHEYNIKRPYKHGKKF